MNDEPNFQQLAAQAQQISVLKNHPGYIALCQLMANEESTVLNSLSVCKEPKEALRLLRYWQVLSRLLEILTTTPENIVQNLQDLHQLQSVQEEALFLPPEMNPAVPEYQPPPQPKPPGFGPMRIK